jgi:hypothetical protein
LKPFVFFYHYKLESVCAIHSTMTKHQRLAVHAQSSNAFDLSIRTMYTHNQADMPGCIEIKPCIKSQTKDYGCVLIVLADVSGSMANDNRIQKLRDGVVRLSELAGRFASMNPELVIIEFNDSARTLLRSETIPSTDELRAICDALTPRGGTNIGAALSAAMQFASAGKAIHVALFTDGEDGYGLQGALGSNEGYLCTMANQPMLWVHCIGICSAVDCKLLSDISQTARRGTFQCIVDDNIARLMGSMWGLMMEAVDCTCFVTIEVEGVCVRKDVILRVCDPPIPCFVTTPLVKKGTMSITAILTVGGTSKTWMRDLQSGPGGAVDELCVREFVAESQSVCNLGVAQAVGDQDFDKADEANAIAYEEIKAFEGVEALSEETVLFVKSVLEELEAQSSSITHARVNEDLARQLEANTMSRTSTARNHGVSIDPASRSLSELQSQLST